MSAAVLRDAAGTRRGSLFTIYNPVSRRPIESVGNACMRGKIRDAAYRFAERQCGERLMFDDTCPHGTAYAICGSGCGAA